MTCENYGQRDVDFVITSGLSRAVENINSGNSMSFLAGQDALLVLTSDIETPWSLSSLGITESSTQYLGPPRHHFLHRPRPYPRPSQGHHQYVASDTILSSILL